MLKERLTEARWIIWLHDPAIAAAHAAGQITTDQIYAYAQSMDLADFGGADAVDGWPEAPVLFKMAPMTTDLIPIEENDLSLFAFTCRELKNAPLSWCKWTTRPDKSRYLDDDAREKIPLGCVRDLAEWVRQAATRDGGDLPFTPPDGWAQSLSRSIARAAIRARTGRASTDAETPPSSDS